MSTMKAKAKPIGLFFVMIILAALMFAGCSNGSDSSDKTDEKRTCTIYYITNGGTEIPPSVINEFDIPLKPADPTKDGYTFEGWYYDEALTIKYDFTSSLTIDTYLYAKWTSNTKDDSKDDSNNQKKDSNANNSTDPKTNKDNNNNKQKKEKQKYTVTFNSEGGSEVASQSVEESNKATKPADPTKTDSEFLGWYEKYEGGEYYSSQYDFDSILDYDLILYAKWKTVYTVSFDSNGGSTIASQKLEPGKSVTPPAEPAKEGYIFSGWYADAACNSAYDFNSSVITTKTLYAKWRQKTYKVSFYADGGRTLFNSTIPVQIVVHGGTATTPATVTKSNATFAGWYSDSALTTAFDFSTPITADKTVYAKWNIAQGYKQIRFVTNGGSEITSLILSSTQTVTQPSNPVRPHYKFEGWYSNEALTTAYTFGNTITADTTIYAKWSEVPYLVTVINSDISVKRTENSNGEITFESEVYGDWYVDGYREESNKKSYVFKPYKYNNEVRTYVIMFKYKNANDIYYSYTVQIYTQAR